MNMHEYSSTRRPHAIAFIKSHLNNGNDNVHDSQPSISNSSVHNTEAPNYNDSCLSAKRILPSTSKTSSESSRSNGRDSESSIFYHKSCHSPEVDRCPRNQSQSSVCTVLGAEPDPCSTAPYAPERESSPFGFPSFEDDGASSLPATPRSSWDGTLSLATDPGTSAPTFTSR